MTGDGFLKKSESGVTLIELIVAMTVLTFGVVAALSILVEAHKSNSFARAKTMAINAAEQQIEEIFERDPTMIMTFNNRTFAVGDLVGPGGNPPGSVIVDINEPHQVTVTVAWQGSGTLPSGTVSINAIRSEANRS
ncbi:MAG: hypothetical protein C4520_05665 [Candidatus Abyssobacteria bacterium SURF_5]|uniref:Prepilin-type N-terminal cleavage/methylation domain-containing protein n=1 Tax=Abyssobacteria bacterium (strain SURF_5) TaxID=2093360 RepID=A0A3A4NT64_ABYX5|nr:MAG: hypothetical protein C4520_05665 [Candidatus Abyssubacteria bacterium SURF_5]